MVLGYQNSQKKTRQMIWTWKLIVIVFCFVWMNAAFLQNCVISPANLECRPCPKDSNCGSSFTCRQGVCRPFPLIPSEFIQCEHMPSLEKELRDGGE